MSDDAKYGSPETAGVNQDTALKFLERIARASSHPEKFTDLCADWASLPNSTLESEEFASAIDNILILERGKESHTLTGGASGRLQTSASDYVQISRTGRIETISTELSDILGRKVGDSISAAILDQPLPSYAASGEIPLRLSEIADRFGVQRLVHFAPVLDQNGEVQRFVARISRRRIPEKTQHYMRIRFGLTPAELRVLDLVLQRYRTEQIADLRKISINTVRTHTNRILKKLNCRSLTESIAYLEEIAELIENYDQVEVSSLESHGAAKKQSQILTLPNQTQVEYRRFGAPTDKPLILLHSLEYGCCPPPEFISEARERGYCLYFPLRPGFGETTPASDLSAAASIIDAFIEALDLREARLVGFSMAAPTALHMKASSFRFKSILLATYAINATDKIRPISTT